MRDLIYAENGPWDHFAGPDGRMTFDEATKMDKILRAEMAKHVGGKLPEENEGFMKRAFKLYSGLGEGEGFTKAEA